MQEGWGPSPWELTSPLAEFSHPLAQEILRFGPHEELPLHLKAITECKRSWDLKTLRPSLRGHQASLGPAILSLALVPWASPSAELAAQQLLLPMEAQL